MIIAPDQANPGTAYLFGGIDNGDKEDDDDSDQGDILLSDDVTSSGWYRNHQEVQVNLNPSSSKYLGDASWYLDLSNNYLSITVAMAGTGDNGSWTFYDTTLGFHWAMSCANDVIEGKITTGGSPVVPEPATMILFGSGLIGLAGLGRRRFLKKG